MNQKTIQGQRLIDHAKTAIENFINKVRDKKKQLTKSQLADPPKKTFRDFRVLDPFDTTSVVIFAFRLSFRSVFFSGIEVTQKGKHPRCLNLINKRKVRHLSDFGSFHSVFCVEEERLRSRLVQCGIEWFDPRSRRKTF